MGKSFRLLLLGGSLGVVSRHYCILSQCDIFYRESSRVRGLLSSYAMANNINTSRRLIFYLTLFFFFFFRVYFVIVVLFISPFLRGFNSIDRSDSKEQRNSSLSLHSNCNNSQCARCTVHTVFRSLTLCCLLWKKNLLLCVCCTHNKRI